MQCVVRVGQHAIPVARIELADELQIEAINRHDQTVVHRRPDAVPRVPRRLRGRGRDARRARPREIAAEFGGGDFAWAADEAERRRLWHARHGAMEATRAMRPGSGALTTDVCVPVSALATASPSTQADIAEHGLTASIVGHVGDGNFHAIVLVDPDDPAEVARGEEFHARLVRRALEHEGTCTGEHGVGYGKARFLVEEHGRGRPSR